MYATSRGATSSRSTTSQNPSYKGPYVPDLLQSAVYSRTTQTNPSSGSYQQWRPSVAATRRRDSDIESFVPSINNIPTTNSPSPTPGYGSDNAPSSRSRTYFASAIPQTLRRPSNTSSRQSFDRDSDSQSTISATPKLPTDSSERRPFKGLRQKDVAVVKTAERSARSREREVLRDAPVEQRRLEPLRSSPEETASINAQDETPTLTSTELVIRKQDSEPEAPQADFSTSLVPATMRRENSSSLSSMESPSDGDASRKTQETTATSVSSSSSPIAGPKVRRPSRDAPFNMLFGEETNVPKPAQATVTDPQAPRKEPPPERSYPKSPPPAPLMMPLTLPDRNSIVEVPIPVPTEEAAPEQAPPLAIKAPKPKPSRKRVISKPKFLAITEGSGSGGEEKRPSMADHPKWPKYLRLPQSPMSVSEALNTPELEPASLPKDDDEVVYQPPLPAKPTPPRLTPPRARRRSNSGARGKRKNSSDDTVPPNEPPSASPTSPRQRRQSSPSPLAVELPPPAVPVQTTSPSGPRKETSPVALRPTTPLSTRRVSLKQEDISPSYFDLRSPSTDKLPLVESSVVAPALPVSTIPDLIASIFPPEPPVPVPPVTVREEPKPVVEVSPPTEQRSESPKPKAEQKRAISPAGEARKPVTPPEGPRNTSPTPSVAHRPYLADYSRHFRTRSNSSISQITTAATGQATPASEQAVPAPAPAPAVPTELPPLTIPSRPSSPARDLKKKESKGAVSSRQKPESQPPAVPAPSRPLVPPIFPFGRKRGDSSASSKVPQSSLEAVVRERRNSHVSAKSVDPPAKPLEEVSPVEIKTPIYEIYKAKSTFAVVEPPKESQKPSQTEKQGITSAGRHSPAEQPESEKTLTPRRPEVPLISQAVLAKVLVEADEPDDASTIGHALDMFPPPPPVGQAIDTPPTEPVRQGRYPITVPDVKMSSRMDSPPTIRERHIRRPSLQVEQLPEIRSESPVEVKRPNPAPVQAPVPTPPEPVAERTAAPAPAPAVQFHPPPPPAVHPTMGASPSKESIQLPQRVTERKVAPSKPPTTLPPSMSLKRPSLERVPTGTPASSTTPPQAAAAPISTRDRSASASSKLPIPVSQIQPSAASQKTEPPPLPPTNPPPPVPQPSGHSHSRSNGTIRDFDIGSPAPAARPTLPTSSEEPIRSIRSRTRTHEREASAPSATPSPADPRAHSSSRHGHSASARNGASLPSSRAHAGLEPSSKVPPLPSKVSEAPAAAPAPPPRHVEPSPPEAPPKPSHPSRHAPPTASSAPASKDPHRRHRAPLDNPTASPAPPPLPKLPRDPSPVPVTRHRSESPVGSGSSQVTDIVPGVPAKAPATSKRTGLLRGLFSRGDASRGEVSSKSSSRRAPLPPPPASHQSSSSERVDIPPVPSRPAASRSKPPTTAPPTHHHRSTPSPVPSITAQRRAEPTPTSRSGSSRPPIPAAAAPASVPRKTSAPKDKGILSSVSNMFNRRQHYAVSAASLEAVLGASNNNPTSPTPSNINLEISDTPDRNGAVMTWRTREAAAQKTKIRRPGVTFADLGSEPGSPTAPARSRA
ncbi:hypothetical protein FRC01_014431 [Tulasnella sp. 417]|nr:hypothetical protein FRC01_014431 [Tulasnella sp. 417]